MSKNVKGNLSITGALQAGNEMTLAEVRAIWENTQPVSDNMASYTWAQIKAIAESGRAPSSWLGKTKTDVGTDSTTRTFRVCDMQGLYGKHIVFEQVGLTNYTRPWTNNSSNVDDDNAFNNYSISSIRTSYILSLFDAYSSSLKAVITDTTYKVAKNGYATSDVVLELTDKLFLPAEKEIFGSRTYSRTEESNALTQFAYYVGKSASDLIKYDNGTAQRYWLRSPSYANTEKSCCISSTGAINEKIATNTYRFAPIFAL